MSKIQKINNDNENLKNAKTYLNLDDNLLYCILCHTPIEKRIERQLEGKYSIFKDGKYSVPCKCRSEQITKRREQDEKLRHEKAVESLKNQGFKDRKMIEWTFKNDNGTTPNISTAKKYVENFAKMKDDNIGLLLWGDVGTGKSFFASCIANSLIEQEIRVIMTNFAYVLNELLDLQTNKNEYINTLNRNTLVIIDDFGAERNTPYALEQLYNVIDSRYTSNKPLIVTTNLTLAELHDKNLDTQYRRLYDRILEMCVPIQFQGTSKRNENAKSKLNIAKELLS